MDWFELLTGFQETSYEDTRSRLTVDGDSLHSLVNGKRYGIGSLELVSLSDLRERVKLAPIQKGQLRVSIVTGDVRHMHRTPENAGALFQVASQFNLLEMVNPDVSPEDGVTRYQQDRTQGPACAIAAGAATIYRNYFAPIKGEYGQTATRQLDGLSDLGAMLSSALSCSTSQLWRMKNGYALCTSGGLKRIATHLQPLDQDALDRLRGKLRIGLHRDVEVTDTEGEKRPVVSQAFCSALPVTYSDIPTTSWEQFARLVLEATYEATILCGLLNAARGRSNRVLLTAVGGGVFGNHSDWIDDAMVRALEIAKRTDLDVRLVSFGPPSSGFIKIREAFG